MAWRAAPAVKSALAEATKRWPDRSRKHDGTIGDTAHKARISDHNADSRGVVLAFDLSHDPVNGCDAHALVRRAVARRDPRIRYAISDGGIWSAVRADEGWREYDGANAHVRHIHISVHRAHEDDTSPWWPPLPALKVGERDYRMPDTISLGATGRTVKKMQALLRWVHGHTDVSVTGTFGPADDAALRKHQAFHKLDVDGVCGSASWRTLIEK